MIRPITQLDWPAIMAIQAEVYHAFEPEPLAVMQSKWVLSPETCVVFEHQGQIVGYCLAHPWGEVPPNLNECLPRHLEQASTLYLHDMAFSKSAQGLGGGKALLNFYLDYAKAKQLPHLTLVAVQGADRYWQKQGFNLQPSPKSLADYGDDAVFMRRLIE